ncbi:hypothetical protein FNV43_RR01965 [Rhamnella rubrinervis]|uniref:Uncharacterized protein n=1 Tax=Rhamnella rubrinervis TaxID=2594499 RepID=A0A8K0HSD9_9ROSA|nr:hypothetical protein FNV43_RR01965 [Rhamnella rubrinervis]
MTCGADELTTFQELSTTSGNFHWPFGQLPHSPDFLTVLRQLLALRLPSTFQELPSAAGLPTATGTVLRPLRTLRPQTQASYGPQVTSSPFQELPTVLRQLPTALRQFPTAVRQLSGAKEHSDLRQLHYGLSRTSYGSGATSSDGAATSLAVRQLPSALRQLLSAFQELPASVRTFYGIPANPRPSELPYGPQATFTVLQITSLTAIQELPSGPQTTSSDLGNPTDLSEIPTDPDNILLAQATSLTFQELLDLRQLPHGPQTASLGLQATSLTFQELPRPGATLSDLQATSRPFKNFLTLRQLPLTLPASCSLELTTTALRQPSGVSRNPLAGQSCGPGATPRPAKLPRPFKNFLGHSENFPLPSGNFL